MYLTGHTQWDIANSPDVGVTQSVISEDLKAIRAEWVKEARTAYGRRVAQEMAKLDRVEAEAWRAWERSQADAVTIDVEDVPAVAGDNAPPLPGTPISRKVKKAGRDGSAEFLRIVGYCVEKRVELVGLLGMADKVKELSEKLAELTAKRAGKK
ncbi:hypothetical protein FRUB_10305 [Fimbriiglobus ruber]|uniref:Uncharacterized protein n=1 Tax=Fimbriiglobus ruber TaxID=1908690 RepID=A0A225D3W8_9BACT|nr:hypothetical protein FRUB_10305 [Fimbriiglobus ruber]